MLKQSVFYLLVEINHSLQFGLTTLIQNYQHHLLIMHFMYFQDAHLVHFQRKREIDVTIVWVSEERWLIVQMTKIFLLY